MKWLVVFLVCLARYSEGGALRCASGDCLPLKKETSRNETRNTSSCKALYYREDCAFCYCLEAGVPGCWTQEDCFRTYQIPEKLINCIPKQKFTRDCNTCICMDNGYALCTTNDCQKSTIPKKSSTGKECAKGSHWQSQCNDCVCSEEGYAMCTEKACTGQESEPLLQCAPDTVWNSDCNTCWCTADGRAICTRVGCSVEVVPEFTSTTKSNNENLPELERKPDHDTTLMDEQYKVDTKTERNDNEKAGENFDVSTGISEDSSPELYDFGIERPDHSIEKVDHEIAQPNRDLEDVYKIEEQSNILEETPAKPEHVHNVLKRSVCKSNAVFQLECNTCKCLTDGQSYTCTQNECMEGEKNKEVEVFMEDNEGLDHSEHSVCKPRGTFYIGCNTCHCNVYGTDYSCTNKPCPLPEDVEIFHELKASSTKTLKNDTRKIVCVANRMFIKDCNTCWCNEDGTGFFCTRKVCVPEEPEDGFGEEKTEELRIIKKDCRPDEVFEIDCNMCRCNPDGKTFSCTRRACVDSIEEDFKNTTLSRKTRGVSTQEAPKTCQPGQEFRMDCNKCLCDNEGQDFSCTRNDCNAVNGNGGGPRSKRDISEKIAMTCTPESVFDKDCNVCRCTSDGHHAMCTTKPCPAPNAQENDVSAPLPEADPNFRCNPGEQLKRGCKDCSCSADGKSVFCTVKFCDQDITPPPSL